MRGYYTAPPPIFFLAPVGRDILCRTNDRRNPSTPDLVDRRLRDVAGKDEQAGGQRGEAKTNLQHQRWTTIKRKIDAATAVFCGVHGLPQPAPWVLHDLRRTAASGLAGLKVPQTTIGKILNHASDSITGRIYDKHAYHDEKAAALELWSEHLRHLINTPRGDVRPFHKDAQA